eukprot:3676681-Heterocapsa_arctica.AAC.1
MGLTDVNPQPGAWVGIVIADDDDWHEWAWASIDSGSDVHTMPRQMQKYGRHETVPEPNLRDVQGGFIKTGGRRS